jgi:hypothetical protein
MFRGLRDFKEIIADFVLNRPKLYQTIKIDLSTARKNHVLALTGTYFKVIEATDINANIQVKFNSTDADALTFRKRTGVIMPFVMLYISNEAQAGKTVTYLVGLEGAPLELFDESAVIDIQSIADPVTTNLQGYNDESDTWEKVRCFTAQAHKPISAGFSSSNQTNDIWTPASGKAILVQGYRFFVHTDSAYLTGVKDIKLGPTGSPFDNIGQLTGASMNVAIPAVTMLNKLLPVDDVLTLSLSSAMTGGNAYVTGIVWGQEV